jgi:hypothetical protein
MIGIAIALIALTIYMDKCTRNANKTEFCRL